MPPSYKLYAPEASFRAFSTLIAAEYNGVGVEVNTDVSAASTVSPVGKLPVLTHGTTGEVIAFSSHAAARFIASLRRDGGLLGTTLVEAAAVDAWMDWASTEVELPACVWFYPVAGYMPFNATSYEKAKTDLAKALAVLNDYLLDKTYLVGHAVTLADIVVASTLLYPFKLVTDKNYLKPFGNVVRWFQTCVNQPSFVQVVGQVTLCKKELTAPGQTATAAAPAAGGKKEGGKKEKKEKAAAAPAPEEDYDEPAPVKKEEHPYKIMDKEAPSPFSMDAWKKTYSNTKDLNEAMKIFWETFDANGWSLWKQDYNYNAENKMIFMTCNAVGGFQQRSDEIRRWAFGVMDVVGTEDTVLEITGVWLLRGQTVQHMLQANDDANWYTWALLAGQDKPVTDDVKKIVHDYWTADTTLDGKTIQDSRVFK